MCPRGSGRLAILVGGHVVERAVQVDLQHRYAVHGWQWQDRITVGPTPHRSSIPFDRPPALLEIGVIHRDLPHLGGVAQHDAGETHAQAAAVVQPWTRVRGRVSVGALARETKRTVPALRGSGKMNRPASA